MTEKTKNSWKFLNTASNETRQLLVAAARKHDFIDDDEGYKALVKKLTGRFSTYRAFSDKVYTLTKPEKLDDRDFAIMAQFVKSQLLDNDSMRETFAKVHGFTSVGEERFAKEFDRRLRQSEQMRAIIPSLCLSFAAPEKTELIQKVLQSAQSLLSLSRITPWTAIGIAVLMHPLGTPALIIADALYKGAKSVVKWLFSDDDELWLPFYAAVVCIHFLESNSIKDLKDAELYVSRTIIAAEKGDGATTADGSWSDVRKALLHAFASKAAQDNNLDINGLITDKALSADKDATAYIAQAALDQLLPYSEKLIDLIYGFDVTATAKDWAFNTSINADLKDGTIIFEKYYLPYTRIRDNRYFLVADPDSQQAALTRLYVALSGFDPSKHVISTCDDRDFDYIVVGANISRVLKRQARRIGMGTADRTAADASVAESAVQDYKLTISRLESELQLLRHRMSLYTDLFVHLRHDVRPRVLMPIDTAVKKYREVISANPGLVSSIDEKYCNKAITAIEQLYDEFKTFDNLKGEGKSIAQATDITLDKLLNIQEERMSVQMPDTKQLSEIRVKTDAAGFRSKVLANILDNAWTHGFPTETLQKSAKIKVEVMCDDNEVMLSFSNNGLPFSGDPDRAFDHGTKYGPTGHTGEGLYLVRNFMCTYGGNAKIAVAPESEYPFSIILIFKQ